MSITQWAKDRNVTMAVWTRSGSLIHLWNPRAFQGSRTHCGREAVDLHYGNVDEDAATCNVCIAHRAREVL